MEVSQQAGGFAARVQHAPPGHRFALELCRGEQMIALPVEGSGIQFCPDSASIKTRVAMPRLYPTPTDQPEAFRVSLRRYLDWERVTPIEEINVRTWRGWAKRTLRRIKT